MIIPELVKKNFSRYPEYYNASAEAQKRVAAQLVSIIAIETEPRKIENLLELGCGTGFLTKQLITMFPISELMVTDISSEMVDYCKNSLHNSGQTGSRVTFATHDISKEALMGSFNLIASSLAFQWVENINKLINNLYSNLSENGILIFSTLLQGTFANIEQLFKKHNINFPLPELQSINNIKLAASCFRTIEIIEKTYTEKYDSTKKFLDHIHKIGAGNATGNRIPFPKLRELLIDEKEAGERTVEYKVAFVVGRK